jgi:hypothetical protein
MLTQQMKKMTLENGTVIGVIAPRRARPGTRSCRRAWLIQAQDAFYRVDGYAGAANFRVVRTPSADYTIAPMEHIGSFPSLDEAFQACTPVITLGRVG